MKKVFFFFYLSFHLAPTSLWAQTASIPDPAFLNFLKTEYPSTINVSDQLIISQAAMINGNFSCNNLGITSLEGIQYFINIDFLHADDNNITFVPDISSLAQLKTLNLQGNNLSVMPSLAGQPLLEKLFISKNKLTKIPDLTNNLNLTQIIAFSNLIDSLPFLNHLINLDKIDVGNNLLKKLPDMSALVKMEQLLVWDNFLDSIPNLANYPNLWRLNAGGNQLKYTPDFSLNPRLKILFLNENQLTVLPNISLLDSLDNVRFQNNNFDFQDLSPILSYPGKDTIYNYSPQNDFPGDTIQVLANDSLFIPSGIASYGFTTYQWYLNGTHTYTTNTPFLKVHPAISGQYYVVATSNSFPGLNLKTDSFTVISSSCVDLSGITFDIEGVKCLKAGALWINSASLPTGNYTYYLSGGNTTKTQSSISGKFNNLTEPNYSLTISNGVCMSVYPSIITLPMEACEETFITPNGDNDKDSYFFNQTGKVVIYDKQGRKVKQLDLPGEWNGIGADGKLVPQGYYISNINNGEELVNISVIY